MITPYLLLKCKNFPLFCWTLKRRTPWIFWFFRERLEGHRMVFKSRPSHTFSLIQLITDPSNFIRRRIMKHLYAYILWVDTTVLSGCERWMRLFHSNGIFHWYCLIFPRNDPCKAASSRSQQNIKLAAPLANACVKSRAWRFSISFDSTPRVVLLWNIEKKW